MLLASGDSHPALLFRSLYRRNSRVQFRWPECGASGVSHPLILSFFQPSFSLTVLVVSPCQIPPSLSFLCSTPFPHSHVLYPSPLFLLYLTHLRHQLITALHCHTQHHTRRCYLSPDLALLSIPSLSVAADATKSLLPHFIDMSPLLVASHVFGIDVIPCARHKL
jgi:hypothetical protein